MLIDSHIFLWLLQEPHKIGNNALRLISESGTIFVSSATVWELGLKYKKGKLGFSPDQIIEGIEDLGCKKLEITLPHIVKAVNISGHTDPFDNILISQATTENIPFVTCDKSITKTASLLNVRIISGYN